MTVKIVDVQHTKEGQAIKLPEGFTINDDKVYLKKTGNIISIIPYHHPWQNFQDSFSPFTDDFMDERNQAPQQNREAFD
jgi:antitoxin VapB